MCATSISQTTVSKLNTDLSLWVETQEVGHWKMLSDNFSMEGSCKRTHCKRTAHRKERKEVAISFWNYFCPAELSLTWFGKYYFCARNWSSSLDGESNFKKKTLGASWPLSFQVWSPAQVFQSPKIFNPSGLIYFHEKTLKWRESRVLHVYISLPLFFYNNRENG